MEEAKLSIAARRDLGARMVTGAPLPKPRARSAPPQPKQNLFGLKKNYYFTKRTERQIQDKGDYQIEPYRSLRPTVDRIKEKEALQNQMAFGNKTGQQQTKRTKRQKPVPLTRQARLDELAYEVQDRVSFLQDMLSLGQAARYEQEMKQEIAAKLREIARVQRITDKDFAAIQGESGFS